MALGLGLAACQRGMSVGFTTAAALVHEMMEARDERRLLNAAATVLLLTVVLATAVMAQGTDDPVTVDLSDIKEDAVRQLFDDSGKMIDPNQRLAIVAQEHEGGFGGFYFHETDKSIAYVYMQDVTKTTAAEKAFNAAYNGADSYAGQ